MAKDKKSRWNRNDLPDTMFDHIVAVEINHELQRFRIHFSEQLTKDLIDFWHATGLGPQDAEALPGKTTMFRGEYKLIEGKSLPESLCETLLQMQKTKAYPMTPSKIHVQ
jgi:hypothetical protein